MEYENMRVLELKSLARERRLRGYSRMRKAELAAFLTTWIKIILRCAVPAFTFKGSLSLSTRNL